MIPINKESELDPFYRYKMPKILSKNEGNKTRLLNIDSVSKALERHEVFLLKFLGYELGTNTNINSKILNGFFTESVIQETIYKFINTYVCCSKCSNPETILFVLRDKLRTECKACGSKIKIDNDRFSNKNY